MIDYIIKKLAESRLKRLLDDLPFDGMKTVIGVLILILSAAAAYYQGTNPQYAQIIQWVIDLLQNLDPADVGGVSLVVIITGLVHKLLKWIDKLWQTKNKGEPGASTTS